MSMTRDRAVSFNGEPRLDGQVISIEFRDGVYSAYLEKNLIAFSKSVRALADALLERGAKEVRHDYPLES